MRSVLLMLLLLVPASAFAGAPSPPTASAANLLRHRPGPWRLPATHAPAALRFEPETGEALDIAAHAGRGATVAALRRAAAANSRRHADGSRHSVLGAAFRSWTVVSEDAQGRLVEDCVDDLDEARRRVDAADRQVKR